ncbi:MAG: DUF3619 family protein [Burkholderiales bacterium]
MNELQFGDKVRQILNQGTRLEARTAERLRSARERALERRRAERESALVLAGNVLGKFGGLGGFSLRLVLPALLLVFGLVAIYNWQQSQRLADLEEIDALLLADDLPIDAYLDRGFEAWLKKRSAR